MRLKGRGGALLVLVGLAAGSWGLAESGLYGWTLFVLVPLLAGAATALIGGADSIDSAMKYGAFAGLVGCLLFLIAGLEGIVCIVMALPAIVPLTTVGGILGYALQSWLSERGNQTLVGLLIPLSLWVDLHAKPPVYAVTTQAVIHATPEKVWPHVVAFPAIETKPDWLLRTGVAYPIRTRIDGDGIGVGRGCDLSTGTVEERVETWEEGHRLRFTVTATPPAMKETGLYGPVSPKHLTGYYISRAGQFELVPVAGGDTLLIGTSWYQHGLEPAWYWRWWTDLVVHHIHQRVLNHIRTLSEQGQDQLARSAH